MTAAPAVALIHGLRGSPRDWFRFSPELQRAAAQIGAPEPSLHAITLPGHRPVEGLVDTNDRRTFAEAYREVARRLDAIADLRCIVAHSWGARFALEYAVDRPDRSLVFALVSPYFANAQLSGLGAWIRRNPRSSARLQWAIHHSRVLAIPALRMRLFREFRAYDHEGRPAHDYLADDQHHVVPTVLEAFADTPDFDALERLGGQSPRQPEAHTREHGARFLLFWCADDGVLLPRLYPALEEGLRRTGRLLEAVSSREGGHNPQIHAAARVAGMVLRHL